MFKPLNINIRRIYKVNKTSFDYNGNRIGELSIDAKNIYAIGGKLYPRLIFPTTISLKKSDTDERRLPKFTIINVTAELFVGGIDFKVSDSTPIPLEIDFDKTYDRSNNLNLDFPLDTIRLNAIENCRSGDLVLKLLIKFQFAQYKTVGNEQPRETLILVDCFRTLSFDLSIEIPQSYWISRVLPNLGLGEFFIVEIPKGNQTLTKAWKYLELAETSLKNWDSKGVFANCREIGIHLNSKLETKFGKTSFAYAERWSRAFAMFKHLSSLELHLEDVSKSKNNYTAEELRTQKIDSEHLILNAKLLVKYAEDMFNE
jgi:hypothetical protein